MATLEESAEGEALGVRRAAQRRMEIELGLNYSFAPVEDILYLSRILYSAPSNGDWGELELDYILFLRSGETPVLTPIQR